MPQPQAYERQTDFTERDGDDTDHSALNQELDAAALSIDGIRDNLALIQRDDGALKNGIVTADTIAPNAFDAIFSEAIGEAEAAAAAAQISAINADDARDDVAASAAAAATSQTAAALNATDAANSANEADAARNGAVNSANTAVQMAGLASESRGFAEAAATAAQASQAAAATSATNAANSFNGADGARALAVQAANNAAASNNFAFENRGFAETAAAAAAASQTAAANSATASAASATTASGAATTATTQAATATTQAAAAATSATSAANSANEADAARDDAVNSANNAAASNISAFENRGFAETAAAAAAASQTAAATSATTATTQASNASASASAAAASAAGISAGLQNIVTNGHFLINQRNYTGGAVPAANTYVYDRWRVLVSGQSLPVASGGNTFDRRVTVPAGGIRQLIDFQDAPGGTYTINWTGTATCTVFGVARANGGTFSLPGLASGTIQLDFYNGTLGQVQLRMGTAVTPFERRPIEVELALCQRYYESTFNTGVTPASSAGLSGALVTTSVAATSGTTAVNWQFMVEKRAAPTITLFNPSAAGSDWRNTTSSTNVAATATNVGTGRATITISGTPTAGQLHAIHAVASSEF